MYIINLSTGPFWKSRWWESFLSIKVMIIIIAYFVYQNRRLKSSKANPENKSKDRNNTKYIYENPDKIKDDANKWKMNCYHYIWNVWNIIYSRVYIALPDLGMFDVCYSHNFKSTTDFLLSFNEYFRLFCFASLVHLLFRFHNAYLNWSPQLKKMFSMLLLVIFLLLQGTFSLVYNMHLYFMCLQICIHFLAEVQACHSFFSKYWFLKFAVCLLGLCCYVTNWPS